MDFLKNIYQIIMYVFLTYIFTSLFLSRKKKKKEHPIVEDFFCYFLVPCVNEEAVIKKTLEKLVALPVRKKIIAIDDGSTDRTAEIIEAVKGPIQLLKRVKPKARIGKGAALNQAFELLIENAKNKNLDFSNVLVGVIDADGFFSENIVTELKKSFSDPAVCAVQARVKMSDINHIMFATQDVEFFTVNNIIQKARLHTNTVGLGGNGQFFRLSDTLDQLGKKPWGDALLDDYELTLKLMMKGLKIQYIDQAYVSQEALKHVGKFIKQRSRWVQGNLDCLHYIPRVRKSSKLSRRQEMGVYYFLAQPFINLIADLLILFMSFEMGVHILSVDMSLTVLVGIALGILISVLFGILFTIWYLYDLKKLRLSRPSFLRIICLPFSISYIYIILFVSILLAFYRFIVGNKQWIKTDRN